MQAGSDAATPDPLEPFCHLVAISPEHPCDAPSGPFQLIRDRREECVSALPQAALQRIHGTGALLGFGAKGIADPHGYRRFAYGLAEHREVARHLVTLASNGRSSARALRARKAPACRCLREAGTRRFRQPDTAPSSRGFNRALKSLIDQPQTSFGFPRAAGGATSLSLHR